MQIDHVNLQFEDIKGDLILIENNGAAIASSNFWDTVQAQRGLVFLSWNAGSGRLLLPDSQRHLLEDMRTAQFVIVSRGIWTIMDSRVGLELLFEDESDAPFAIHIVENQFDRDLPATNESGGFAVTVWTRDGEQLRLPGKYRRVDSIPCLDPWSES